MEKRNLPTTFSPKSSPLWKDIKKFSGNKYSIAAVLVFIGMLGIFIPVIPGILFFLFAAALFKPGLMTKIRAKIKSFLRK